jgi:hypothetical protein
MSDDLVRHDFNVALVTAAAGLLGLVFVALSIHIDALRLLAMRSFFPSRDRSVGACSTPGAPYQNPGG